MTLTTEILIDDFLILIGFVVFMFIQAIVINGIYDCFKGGCVNDINKGKVCTGSIFYLIKPSFFEKYKHTNWSKNIFFMPEVHGIDLWECYILVACNLVVQVSSV